MKLSMKHDRIARYQKGHTGENWAALYLWLKGYKKLALRYKTKLGEIDLVMAKGRQLVFCEVKARAAITGGLEAVSPKSQQRIGRAARIFLQKNPKYQNYASRFDVVVVRPYRVPYHLKDAWRP